MRRIVCAKRSVPLSFLKLTLFINNNRYKSLNAGDRMNDDNGDDSSNSDDDTHYKNTSSAASNSNSNSNSAANNNNFSTISKINDDIQKQLITNR